jgi:hypothetical protein
LEKEPLTASFAVVREVSSCRRLHLGRALMALSLATGGALTTLVMLFFAPLLASLDPALATAFFLLILAAISFVVYQAARHTFRYTIGFSEDLLKESWSRYISLGSFEIIVLLAFFLLVIGLHSIWKSKKVVYATPFVVLALLKLAIERKNEGKVVSGTVLLSLTLISSVLDPARALTALSTSYSISSTIEAMVEFSEAERCVVGDSSPERG